MATAKTTTTRRTINQAVVTPPAKKPNPQSENRQPTESGFMVTVTIPKAFILTLDDHTQVKYAAGTDEMPLEHANHWYSKVMGVEIFEPKRR